MISTAYRFAMYGINHWFVIYRAVNPQCYTAVQPSPHEQTFPISHTFWKCQWSFTGARLCSERCSQTYALRFMGPFSRAPGWTLWLPLPPRRTGDVFFGAGISRSLWTRLLGLCANASPENQRLQKHFTEQMFFLLVISGQSTVRPSVWTCFDEGAAAGGASIW